MAHVILLPLTERQWCVLSDLLDDTLTHGLQANIQLARVEVLADIRRKLNSHLYELAKIPETSHAKSA